MTDRGVSITLNFALGLTIATLLMSGLLMATGDIVNDRQSAVVEGELTVIGERLVADITAVDRLAVAGADTAAIVAALPETVAGTRYTITVTPTATGGELEFDADGMSVVVETTFFTETDVESATVAGGDVRVELSGGNLEVSHA